MASCNTAKNAVEEHERVALESELGRLAGHGVPDQVSVAQTVSRISWWHAVHR